MNDRLGHHLLPLLSEVHPLITWGDVLLTMILPLHK